MRPGSVEFISDGINTVEQDASVCAHCQRITSIPNRRKMMEHVDICRNCMRLICLDCAGKPCTPYIKEIEKMEEKYYRRRQLTAALGLEK